MDNEWRQNLDKAFGEAPAAPAQEYARILNRVNGARPVTAQSHGQLWPALLCAGSLALGIFVSVFVKPQTTTTDASTTALSMLSVELTSPYDESLESLQDLADQIK